MSTEELIAHLEWYLNGFPSTMDFHLKRRLLEHTVEKLKGLKPTDVEVVPASKIVIDHYDGVYAVLKVVQG